MGKLKAIVRKYPPVSACHSKKPTQLSAKASSSLTRYCHHLGQYFSNTLQAVILLFVRQGQIIPENIPLLTSATSTGSQFDLVGSSITHMKHHPRSRQCDGMLHDCGEAHRQCHKLAVWSQTQDILGLTWDSSVLPAREVSMDPLMSRVSFCLYFLMIKLSTTQNIMALGRKLHE